MGPLDRRTVQRLGCIVSTKYLLFSRIESRQIIAPGVTLATSIPAFHSSPCSEHLTLAAGPRARN